jgi:glutathione S-transferase
VRGPWITSGYFRSEGENALRDGWFPTGDVATIDPDGYMQITDRSKDVIKSGGEWISSIDLENIAVAHPAVAEAAVIGAAHPKWDERPLLVVVKEGRAGGRPRRTARLLRRQGRQMVDTRRRDFRRRPAAHRHRQATATARPPARLSFSQEPDVTTPITLCGFAVSNYYNKVKLSLLEKGVPFEEELAYPSQKEEFRKDSPMGKVPFLRTTRGVLTESQVLTEYIEDNWPEPALYPKDPFERARCRELIEHIELHIELPARRLYARSLLRRHGIRRDQEGSRAAAGKGPAQPATWRASRPSSAGEDFTHADCAAFVHLPLLSSGHARRSTARLRR